MSYASRPQYKEVGKSSLNFDCTTQTCERAVCAVGLLGGENDLMRAELHRMLMPIDFTSPVYRLLWETICVVRAENKPVHVFSVYARLRKDEPRFEAQWLAEIVNDTFIEAVVVETGVLECVRWMTRGRQRRQAA